MIGSTLLLIRSLIQNGAIPKPATQAMRQITATRSSQVASTYAMECIIILERTYKDRHFSNKTT